MSSALLNSKLVKAQASRLGFVACGLAKAEPVAESFAIRYRRWLDLDFCGEMDYMRRNVEMRLKPDLLVPGVRTIVSLAMNFMPSEHQPGISLYAQGKDYHDVLRERMQQLMQACGLEGRCFVDTAPVLERYWAWQSGVGIVTQSGLVAVPGYGPTVFLGARLVISYQTIEHRGPLPDNLRLAATFYGCDRCLRATPQFAESHPTAEPAFQPSEALLQMAPDDWQNLTEEQYRSLFKGSAIKRAKYDGLKRNIERWLKHCKS